MDYEFWVIIDRRTGMFLKKSPSANSYSGGLYTDKIGRARIFDSYAKANVGFYRNADKDADWDIERMVAKVYTLGVIGGDVCL